MIKYRLPQLNDEVKPFHKNKYSMIAQEKLVSSKNSYADWYNINCRILYE